MMSKDSTRICILWLDWLPQSENQIRSQHWTVTNKHRIRAMQQFGWSSHSSLAAKDFWTTTIRLLGLSALEMLSPDGFDLTTPTLESDSSMDKSEVTNPEPS